MSYRPLRLGRTPASPALEHTECQFQVDQQRKQTGLRLARLLRTGPHPVQSNSVQVGPTRLNPGRPARSTSGRSVPGQSRSDRIGPGQSGSGQSGSVRPGLGRSGPTRVGSEVRSVQSGSVPVCPAWGRSGPARARSSTRDTSVQSGSPRSGLTSIQVCLRSGRSRCDSVQVRLRSWSSSSPVEVWSGPVQSRSGVRSGPARLSRSESDRLSSGQVHDSAHLPKSSRVGSGSPQSSRVGLASVRVRVRFGQVWVG